MEHSHYMRRAIELARKGTGRVAPNPLVGAVIVKNDVIIGEGWHDRYGALHAERHALKNCTDDPSGADMYVTLEPCCHHGKQPPCTEAIVQAGIRRVYIGSDDPNPLVSGKGIACLKEHGVEVITNVEQAACDALNPVFFHFIRTGHPYVIMKYAMTMDGKIATSTGASQWITGEAARRRVHEDRSRCSAIMAGIGTVLTDDPLLTCRIEGGRNPIRIICDSRLQTPLSSQIVQTASQVPTILATCIDDPEKQRPYKDNGCRVLVLPEENGHLSLTALMQRLGAERIDSILLEGGGTLNWSALEAGIVQKVQTYIAPKLFGGKHAKTPVAGAGVDIPAHAVKLVTREITCIGDDILIESEVQHNVYRDC